MLKRFPAAAPDAAGLAAQQLAGLQWTVAHAFENSPFYRDQLTAAAITPADIGSLDDLQRLPFTTADDLREGYPFPLRAAPFEKLVRVHSSTGTTGKRKILCYTQKDIDDWADMFGRCYELAGLTPEDRVQICVGYGLWTAGIGFQLGCERFGAMSIPVGPGNLEMQAGIMVDLQSTVVCCTASMGLLLAEEVQKRGLRDQIAVRKVILGAPARRCWPRSATLWEPNRSMTSPASPSSMAPESAWAAAIQTPTAPSTTGPTITSWKSSIPTPCSR
jgi:phenylacetate-CoA ligase